MSPNRPTDFRALIPELAEWNGGQGIDIDAWLAGEGDFRLAIAFGRLFWPTFVEHDGCVLFDDFSPESFSGFMAQCDSDRRAVEAVMNHRHLLDYFHHDADRATPDQLAYLGTLLQDTWRAKLARDFPHREFDVRFDSGDADDMLGYIVTFWQPADRRAG